MDVLSALGARRRGLAITALVCSMLLVRAASADEVDDVLGKKAKNRDKVKHFHSEITVETDQPSKVHNPKTTRMHFKMDLTRLPANEVKDKTHPWLMEAEVLEPHSMKLRVRGEQAWFLDHRGNWTELPMTPTVAERFGNMPERFLGANPAEQRKRFGIKVLRHNNPIFGPRTVTLEFVPNTKTKTFSRMEEDIDDDGLPLATRMYDETGAEASHINVTKHHKQNGVPVVDAMEGVTKTPSGDVHSRTNCGQVGVDIQ